MEDIQDSCKRCGACCKEGGPALHKEDLKLIREGKLALSCLITIRKGELVHNPLVGDVHSAKVELVKITGIARSWACRFFSEELGCTIYADRPQACRVLKCWDTTGIAALFEQDTLCRLDILERDHPLVPFIEEHETMFPCHELQFLYEKREQLADEIKSKWQHAVTYELQFRSKAVETFKLGVAEELFYFGRPLFRLLQGIGIKVVEAPSGLRLIWP